MSLLLSLCSVLAVQPRPPTLLSCPEPCVAAAGQQQGQSWLGLPPTQVLGRNRGSGWTPPRPAVPWPFTSRYPAPSWDGCRPKSSPARCSAFQT